MRIVEKTHPGKQSTTKTITMDTSEILSDKSNPETLNMNLGGSESLIRCFLYVWGEHVCHGYLVTRFEEEGDGCDVSCVTLEKTLTGSHWPPRVPVDSPM